MRKVVMVLLVVLTIFGSISVASAEKYIVTTNDSRLNVRLNDDHSKIVGKLAKGQVFEPDYIKGCWAHFTLKGKHVIAYMGYLTKYSTYLKSHGKPSSGSGSGSSVSSKPSSLKPFYEYTKAHVKTSGLRLTVRSAPSFEGKVITWLDNGSTVYVIKKSGSWAKIFYDETHVGYVWADLIK